MFLTSGDDPFSGTVMTLISGIFVVLYGTGDTNYRSAAFIDNDVLRPALSSAIGFIPY
jgi:hypothetical protein